MKLKLLTLLASLLIFTSLIIAQPVPADNATAVDPSAPFQLDWGTLNGGNDVKVRLWTGDPDPNSVNATLIEQQGTTVTGIPDGTPIVIAAAPLDFNTLYYWGVWDKNDNIGAGDPAIEYYEFTTAIATPVITNPTGSPFNYSLTPDIEWTFAGDDAGVTFIVDISDDGFGTIAYSASGATSPHTVGSSLDYNTSYDVRVRATKGAEDNASATEDFKTLLPTPTLDFPVGGEYFTTVGTGNYLEWSIPANTSTGDLYYDVYVGPEGAAGFEEELEHDVDGTTTLYTPLALGTFDWYIVAKDQSGADGGNNTDVQSATEQFEVLFQLFSPVNSLTGVSLTPKFEWYTHSLLTPGDDFIIQIDDDPNFGSIDYSIDASTATESGGILSYQSKETDFATPLANGQKYYWRVWDSTNDYYSQEWYFTVVANVNISLYNPGNGMKLYAYDPATFTWGISQAQGALRYYLQIKASGTAPSIADWYTDVEAEIATPGSIDYFYDHLNDSYRNVNGLDGGTRYYWRVVAYYDDGTTPNAFDYEDRVVKYSSSFYFDTEGGAVKAYPSWPIGGPIYYLDPTFYWYTMQWEPGAHYTVMYSTNNTVVGDSLVNGVTEVYAGTNTYVYIGTDLNPSTTYYWQVRTRYGNEYNYSSVAEFTTYDAPGLVPTAANPSYPTGGLEIYTTAPTFYWWIGAMNVDVNYEVEVSTDNTFGTIDFTFGPTTDLYVQGSGLLPGEYYYWRIKASKTGDPTVYSSTAEFSVTGGLNSYPVANWPVGNPTVYTNTPTLSWYFEGSTLGWFHYKVVWSKKDKTPAQWQDQIDANDSIYVTSDMNETFYTFTSPLEYGETYYWAVAAHDHPAGPYSDFAEGSFTIAGNNASIVQTNPANNTVVLTKSPSFYWYVTGSMLGVTHFRVTYSNTELFNANVETVVTTSTNASVNSPLTEGATYWWYVELSYDNQVTWENPSNTWKFTVDPGANAVVPFVGSPARGVTISENSPTLSWYIPAQSESALSYEVEVSNSSDFSNATKYENLEQLNAKVTELSDGEYFWRVRSKTDGSTSEYSSAGNFKIGSVTSVEDTEELPLTYNIDQNYPNPFNPTTMINYSLPEANHVTIKIYDMLGQEVRTLLSQEVKAGRHSVEWKGDNNYGSKVSSGTYIYRISAGEYMQAKKMILLK